MPVRSRFVRRPVTDRSRVKLGELAARLDDQLTLALALHYGREGQQALTLLQDVLWRVPVDTRIRLLDEALWHTGLHDEVPFLVPSLSAVFRIRNLISHGVTVGETDDLLTLFAVRKGKRQTLTLNIDQLNWAVAAAERCRYRYFLRVEGRIGALDTWAGLYGFAEE